MFKQDVTTNYNLEDATFEIVIMLSVAFALGFLLCYFSTKKKSLNSHSDESAELMKQLAKKQSELEKSMVDKANIKKKLVLEYGAQVDELKAKLKTARADLENCLATKATVAKLEESNKISPINSTDDLKLIEGIGPALAKLLNQAGITTCRQLAETSEETLRQILANAGPRYKVHDPSKWAEQAKLAADGNWDELKLFQERLNA